MGHRWHCRRLSRPWDTRINSIRRPTKTCPRKWEAALQCEGSNWDVGSGTEPGNGAGFDSHLEKEEREARGWNADDPEDAVERRFHKIPFSRTDQSAPTESHRTRLCGAPSFPCSSSRFLPLYNPRHGS